MHLKGDLSVKVFVFRYMGNELVPSLHKWIFHLRIEMQNFNLHLMMQNIRLFNVCEARSKNLNFNPYIFILYFQSNILNYHPSRFADYH